MNALLNDKLLSIAEKFRLIGEITNIEPISGGIINHTYVVTTCPESSYFLQYILQRINTSVFTEPIKLMKNIQKVTEYFSKKLNELKDPHQPLQLIHTQNGSCLYSYTTINGEKEYYRMYNYITESVPDFNSEAIHNSNVVFNTGKAFGHFQRLLADYPIDELEETIPDFHNTPKRYANFLRDVKINACGRAMDVSKEILTIIMNEDEYSLITSRLGKEIPLRVTHNDTKSNNVMMSKRTGEFITVIDLDTVMPGSALFDYGDGVRSSASMSEEDDRNLDNVALDMEKFKLFTDGYLSEMAPMLTSCEVSLLGESIRIITLELAMRFLNDYLNGDTYFRIDPERPQHNLERAHAQLKLAADIEQKMPAINETIAAYYRKYI